MKYNTDNYGPLNKRYLNRIEETISKGRKAYPRQLAIRVDLRLPWNTKKLEKTKTDSLAITRFMKSLNERIIADLKRKKKAGKRVYSCRLRYIWVREFNSEGKKHYHVLLLLNKDAYFHPGDYKKDKGTLSSMISAAWVSALGLSFPEDKNLVHFPMNGYYYLNENGEKNIKVLDELMFRASYMAKLSTKIYTNDERNFGCSQY